VVVNKTYAPVITNGLALMLDAGFVPSYPTTGTTWYDLGATAENGTLNNGPSFNSNGYFSFDGVDDWVSTNYSLIEGTDSSRPISLSFYINPNSTQSAVTNNPIIIGSAYYSGFGLQFTGTEYRIWIRITSGTYSDVIALTSNRFQYINLIWGGVNDSKIYSYINGVLNSESSVTYSDFNQNLNSYPLRIARAYTSGGNTATGYFTGKISSLTVHNKVLTNEEIVQNYYQAPIVTDGLVFMSDAANLVSFESGSTTTYSLVNNYTGTLTNGTTYSSNAGGVFVFDGTNDYIEMPYNSYWDSNVFGTATNFTISCWAKPNLFMNWDTLITKNTQGWYSSPEGASIWTDANGFQGVFSSGVLSNPAGSTVIISYATTNTQKWYHVCFTGDGTTLRLYVDGIQRATGLVASRTVPVTTAAVGPSFGRRDFWNGQMSNMMFYTRGITAQEVWQNFNSQRSRFGI
jgi:hypothetical protein